jgi:hypothetical protein
MRWSGMVRASRQLINKDQQLRYFFGTWGFHSEQAHAFAPAAVERLDQSALR